MLRLVGALLIIGGCSGLGFYYRLQLYEGLKHMRLLRQMLEMIMSEIRYNKSTLPECCRQIGKKTEEPYASALLQIYETVNAKNGQGFAACWQSEMGRCLSELPITKKETDMVLGFATCGGLNDYSMQIRAIEQYRDMLNDGVKRREEALYKQGRAAACLGIMSGLLLVIVLV